MMRGKAIAFTARDRIDLVDIRIPVIRSDEVLVETELTAVSQGTDRAMVAGTYAGVEERYPFIYGYSRVGWVREIGNAVSGLRVGDRVFVGMGPTRLDPADGLGEQGGSYTSHAVVHASDAVRLPTDVDPIAAAIGPLAAVAYQGVVSSDIRANSRVLVAGLGAIGQFSALFSRLHGAEVWAMDPIAARRAIAVGLSGVKPLDPSEDIARRIEETAWGTRPWRGRNGPPDSRYEQARWSQARGTVDVVIDATGRPDAFDAYLPLLAREGCLCLQGYYAKPLSLNFHAAHLKRLTVRTPGGFDQVDYETVLRLLSIVDVTRLVGLTIPAEQAPEALHELLFRPQSDVVCAVIRWQAQ
jgi:2-desacetyl-2-hydroxyethyl bacteriochlorophyllide A dehydrogenase